MEPIINSSNNVYYHESDAITFMVVNIIAVNNNHRPSGPMIIVH